MRKVKLVALSAVLVLLVGCASGESFTKAGYDFEQLDEVAVVAVNGKVEGEAAKNQISDYLNMQFMKKGYSPIERTQVKNVLKEQDFQSMGITDNSTAAQAGQVMNTDAVAVVNIPEFGETISMTVKLIDTENASMVWMGSGDGGTGQTLATLGGAVAGAGAGVAAGGDSTGKAVGGAAGGVAGGVAGHALSPSKNKQVKKVIKQICVNLPSKRGK